MKTPTFPFPVKRGSATVAIYRAETHGYESFIVYYKSAGKTHRKTFPDFAKAKEEAWVKAGELDTGDAGTLSMSSEDRAAWLHVKEALAPSGIAPVVAAAQFAEAHKILNGLSLIDAARLAAKAHNVTKPGATVADVSDELLKDRKANGVGEHHLRVMEGTLDRIAEAFNGMLISSLDGPAIKRFLDALEFKGKSVTPRTRNNYRALIGQLFGFAKFRRYVPQDFESIERIAEYKEKPGAIEIYSPSEIAMLLGNAPDTMLPFLAVGAFAGLRHAEIVRLDWSDVSMATGYITVQAAKAKTGSRRIVPITKNLAQWLAPYLRTSGAVCFRQNMAEPLYRFTQSKAIAGTGFKWKQNALRHSFISYRVADVKDVPRVALEAGNSPAMIFRHYRELVTAETAQAWFAVAPKTAGKIVPMAA
jgi:integrase